MGDRPVGCGTTALAYDRHRPLVNQLDDTSDRRKGDDDGERTEGNHRGVRDAAGERDYEGDRSVEPVAVPLPISQNFS